MNPDYEKQLEDAIDRQLKALPALTAPATLAARVLSAIARPLRLPWYRRSWPTWPAGLRVVSFALLLAVFAGLCFAAWEVPHTAAVSEVLAKVQGGLSSVTAIWNAVQTVLGAAVLALKHLGTGFLLACFAAVALGYLMFVALGAVYLRLAWAPR